MMRGPGISLESSDEGVGGVCFIGIASRSLFARDDVVKNAGRSALVSWFCATVCTCCRYEPVGHPPHELYDPTVA